MRQQVRNHRGFTTDTIYELPDGRRLVNEFDRPARVIDAAGNEMAPSPSELAALLAIAQMELPKKNANGKRLFRMTHNDDWRVAV